MCSDSPSRPGLARPLGRLCRALDGFPKTHEDFVERTRAGGLVSVVSVGAICALVVSDVLAFALSPPRELVAMDVDTMPAGGRIRVLFDIDFPLAPCSALALDVTDALGERQRGVRRAALATPLPPAVGAPSPLAERCGPCFSPDPTTHAADGPCCASCEEVRAAQHARGLVGGWRAAPQCARAADAPAAPAAVPAGPDGGAVGCRAHGSVDVERAAGQLRFRVGAAGLDALSSSRAANVSHLVRSLAFAGGERASASERARERARAGALDNLHFTDRSAGGVTSHSYLVTVVPTKRVRAGGAALHEGYEFSSAEHSEAAAPARGAALRAWAGVTIAFELSPIAVVTVVQPRLLLDLLSSVTAIVGGGVTVAMLIDACLHSLRDARHARRAERWGKLHAR